MSMKRSYRYAGILAALTCLSAPALADNPSNGGTIVLNTYSKVMPKLIGDHLGPFKTVNGMQVPRVGRRTGVGQFNPQIKIDDSPSAAANFGSKVTFLITTTRSDLTPTNDNSYYQGAFALVDLTSAGVQDTAMQYVELPRLDWNRNWQKPNVMATDKHILLVAASEDNGLDNGNPQVVAFVYDKATLQPVQVLNSNRQDSTLKPTNLIELSGKNDGQQYGPHSIQRIPGTANSFVMGVQRQNQNAYVLGVTVDESPAGGAVNLNVNYLTRVIQNARHCRPQVITNAADNGVGFLTSVEADRQPADIGVQALKFDLNTGRVLARTYVAKSSPGNNKYAVQPEIADMGDKIVVSYQMSERTRRGSGPGDGQGHTGGSNFSYVQVLNKADLSPAAAATPSVSAYARHAGIQSMMWGEAGKEIPAIASISGSAEGTGAGFLQVVPWDTTMNTMGTKDPGKLYTLATYTDVAGVVVLGDNNPQDQARGFLYGVPNVPNPGYGGGANAFMPEVKTFLASAVQGYTNAAQIPYHARESIYLSLVPATWVAGQPTTPGSVTPTPGTGPGGIGPLPRTNLPGTNTNPQAQPPPSVIPGGPGPQGPSEPGSGGGGVYGPGNGPEANAGCSVSTTGATGASGLGGLLIGLGALFMARRSRKEGK
jgi:MYXO-CTERM domain-containing protein